MIFTRKRISAGAASAIVGAITLAGAFRPEQPISEIAGLPSAGTRNLCIFNTDGAMGTIGCFGMTVVRRP